LYFISPYYTEFKQTINIISSCKTLFSQRKHFYKQKQLLNHNEFINLWTPEQNYYASTTKFMN